MKKYRLFLYVFILVALAGSAYAIYLWYKPPPSIKNAKAIEISAKDIFAEYEANEKEANKKYIDKVVQIDGVVKELKENQQNEKVVLLESGNPIFGINCTFEQKDIQINPGDSVTIKGLCTGYLTDVVLVRCYLIK